jgi:TolB-like protein
MLKLISLLFFVFTGLALAGTDDGTTIQAQRKRTPTIAVLPFSDANPDAAKQGLGRVISAMFGTHLRNETNFIVLERSSLVKVLDEKQYEEAGLTKETREKLKQMLSVEVLLTGEASDLSGQIQLDLRLISVATGEVVVADFAMVKDPESLRTAVARLAKSIEDRYLRQWMGNLTILVHPVEGEVYLDDLFIGKASVQTPLKLVGLLEGEYRLKVLAGGYQSMEQKVEVVPRASREIQVGLRSLPGSMEISSEPLGAGVFINGREYGKTPMNLDTLAEGYYTIQMEMKNFKPWSQRVRISSGQISEVKAKLEVVPGQILVESAPLGVQVYLGANVVGKTPLLIENVTPGNVNLFLRLDGYEVWSNELTVQPGEKVKVSPILRRLTGKLTVVTTDVGVKAEILTKQGGKVGSFALPIHKVTLDEGTYVVRMVKDKFFTHEETISISPDRDIRIEASLNRKPGRLSIARAAKTAVDVFVDGKYVGKAGGLSKELPEGKHKLFLRNYHGEKSMDIDVVADETLEIPVETLSVGKGMPIWSALGAILLTGTILFLSEVK